MDPMVLIKTIKEYCEIMVNMHENIVGIDSSILYPTNKASGHVDAFNDPLLIIRILKKISS